MTEQSNSSFEGSVILPNSDADQILSGLVGMEEILESLSKTMRASLNPGGLELWQKKYHSNATKLLDVVLRRPQLFILAGDVGTGKTTVAESIGNKVAREEKIRVTLYKLSLNARGSGMVGEMTRLISQAFGEIATEAKKLKGDKAKGGIVFVIDEADSIAQSRELSQMHHEDRAGVNALIRGIDLFSKDKLPVAVILCTNRINALDPAIRRRAAEIFEFKRPNDAQRQKLLLEAFSDCGFSATEINQLVQHTGANGRAFGFTYSDLRQRLIPAAVFDAFPDRKMDFSGVLKIAKALQPTPPFQEK
jgi:AAA+ superfamily predicted ATPase